VYAKIATKIPDAVATKASATPAEMTDILPVVCPICAKVSKIETTVPNNPINGDVEANMESIERPFVASFVAASIASAKTSFETILLLLIKLFKKEFSLTVVAPSRSDSKEALSLLSQLLREK